MKKVFLQERLSSVPDEKAFLCLDPKDFSKHVSVLTNEQTVRRQRMGTSWSVSINSELFTTLLPRGKKHTNNFPGEKINDAIMQQQIDLLFKRHGNKHTRARTRAHTHM